MQLELIRKEFSDFSTIGELFVDGKFQCFTLEDPVRPVKKFGETAIPSGEYKVKLTYSARFRRNLPLLLNVPGFEGIRIHCGNTHHDTQGCILVGEKKALNWIGPSRKAFEALYEKMLRARRKHEDITIEIVEEQTNDAA